MNELELVELFQSKVRIAFADAKRAHDCIFDSNISDIVAISYLNKAIAEFGACDSLYYSCYPVLERDEYEAIYHQFSIFSCEMLRNIETSHSHQWTDIEFQELAKLVKFSAFN